MNVVKVRRRGEGAAGGEWRLLVPAFNESLLPPHCLIAYLSRLSPKSESAYQVLDLLSTWLPDFCLVVVFIMATFSTSKEKIALIHRHVLSSAMSSERSTFLSIRGCRGIDPSDDWID